MGVSSRSTWALLVSVLITSSGQRGVVSQGPDRWAVTGGAMEPWIIHSTTVIPVIVRAVALVPVMGLLGGSVPCQGGACLWVLSFEMARVGRGHGLFDLLCKFCCACVTWVN